jgi:hypothetical protein
MTEKVFSAGQVTAEDVKAIVEARVKAAFDKALATPRLEEAEIEEWWNLYSLGLYQNIVPGGPLAPHKVIKAGETAFVETVIVLNPNPIVEPGFVSPCSILTGYDGIEVTYQTGNLTTWTKGAPADVRTIDLVVDQCTYVDVLEFTPQEAGLFEMHISARILAPGSQFAGFARWVLDRDPEPPWWSPTPGWTFDMPIRFMVYQP